MANLAVTVVLSLVLVDFGSAQLYQKSLNWNNHANGQYNDSLAKSDFGSVTGWKNDRAMISGGNLRITLRKNALSGESGIVSNTRIPDGSAYELDFDVRFHSQFDWSRGGKVGFGLGIGNRNTGCNVPTDGAGGTLRLMWYNDNKRVYFIPYLYHQGMPGPCGNNFGKSYPSTGTIEKGKWYKVHMYVKSNTGSNTNGHVQVKINGETLIDQSIRWTTNDSSVAEAKITGNPTLIAIFTMIICLLDKLVNKDHICKSYRINKLIFFF